LQDDKNGHKVAPKDLGTRGDAYIDKLFSLNGL
jgi:hypothetical protein